MTAEFTPSKAEFTAFVVLKDFVFNAAKTKVELKPRRLRKTDIVYSEGTVFLLQECTQHEFVFSIRSSHHAVLFFRTELEELLNLEAISVLDNIEKKLAIILQLAYVEW